MMSGLSYLDWFLIVLIFVSVVLSALKGFTRELISLGALICGYLLACWFYLPAAEKLAPYVKTREMAAVVAFGGILIAAMIVGALVSHLAGRLVRKAGLGGVDRLLGASFGFVRGVIMSVIVILALAVFSASAQPLVHSRLAPYLVQGARVIVRAAPREMRDRFEEGFRRAEKLWNAQDAAPTLHTVEYRIPSPWQLAAPPNLENFS